MIAECDKCHKPRMLERVESNGPTAAVFRIIFGDAFPTRAMMCFDCRNEIEDFAEKPKETP